MIFFTSCPEDRTAFSVPSKKFLDIFSTYATTAAFHSFPRLFSTNHTRIRLYATGEIE